MSPVSLVMVVAEFVSAPRTKLPPLAARAVEATPASRATITTRPTTVDVVLVGSTASVTRLSSAS
jgi:hypothetical protein